VTVEPAVGCIACVPAVRTWAVSLVATELPDGVSPSATVDGDALPVVVEREEHRVRFVVRNVPTSARLELHLGRRAVLAEDDVDARLFAVLDRARIEYDLKTEAYRVATSARPLHVRLAHLRALELPLALAAALEEVLVARG